jgi:cob(I)alamin adenosyltransferase
MEKGLVHIYCGDGKGKTTAAVGLCTRAAGSGRKVLFVQFLKDGRSGELKTLARIPGVEILAGVPVNGFLRDKDAVARRSTAAEHQARFEDAVRLVSHGTYDILVLDEAMAAVNLSLVPLEAITAFLDTRPAGLEVVLTGREPPQELLDRADYISRIECVRHPYQKGIAARRGIEW